ncbi:ABC transporter permease [Corynebacterium ulceribovis]|uniref:ABC transporter permease n=1 Tax=Corynebacterium ulceribovis TaxID=487732 RepID=UPI00037E8970|nr:ABC transporter permease [Corynebacterium ulceribovis]
MTLIAPRRTTTSTSPWTVPTILSAIIIALTVLATAAPQLFTSGDPAVGVDNALLTPSADHWFGTDSVGRDLYTRVVYGTRQSVLGALLAVTVGALVGTLIGLIAGTSRGLLDTILMRLTDVMLSIPALLLSLSVIVIVGFGTLNAAIAVGVTSIAMFTRLVRSQVLSVSRSDYVEAAYGSGGTRSTVLWRHILPNSLTPVLATAALQFGNAVLQLSVLGFLGYGAPPPTPEWGLIIAEGRDFIATSWWLSILPGVVIVAVVLSANQLSTVIQRELTT